jgi:hypothetical protein
MISLAVNRVSTALGLSCFNITLSEHSLYLQRPKCPQSRLESSEVNVVKRNKF